jgi:hypothetical protein
MGMFHKEVYVDVWGFDGGENVTVGLSGYNTIWTVGRYQHFREAYCLHLQPWKMETACFSRSWCSSTSSCSASTQKTNTDKVHIVIWFLHMNGIHLWNWKVFISSIPIWRNTPLKLSLECLINRHGLFVSCGWCKACAGDCALVQCTVLPSQGKNCTNSFWCLQNKDMLMHFHRTF